MLCKKKDLPNNLVYMDTSEIRLPDGTLINAENRHKHSAMLFLGSLFDSEFGHIKLVSENNF